MSTTEDTSVSSNTVKTNKTQEMLGVVKEKIGSATGNTKLEAEGITQQIHAKFDQPNAPTPTTTTTATSTSTSTETEGSSHGGVVHTITAKVGEVVEAVKDKFNAATGSYHESDPIQRKADMLEGKLATGDATITPPEQPTTTEKISAAIGNVVETVKEAIGLGHHHDKDEVGTIPQKKIDTLEDKLTSGNDTQPPGVKEKIQTKLSETVEIVKEKATDLKSNIKEKITQEHVPDPENVHSLKQKKIDTLETKLSSGDGTQPPGVGQKIQAKVGEAVEVVKEKVGELKEKISTMTNKEHIPDPENVKELPQKRIDTLEKKLDEGNEAQNPTVTDTIKTKISDAVETAKAKAGDAVETAKAKAGELKEKMSSTPAEPDPSNVHDLPEKRVDTLEKKLATGDSTLTPAEMTTTQKVQAKVSDAVESVKQKASEVKEKITPASSS